MSKIEAVKLAARVIVGIGTTTVSNSIIKNNVEPTNLLQQISTGAAAVVIGSMASEATKSHTDAKIDAIVDAWKAQTEKTEPTPA